MRHGQLIITRLAYKGQPAAMRHRASDRRCSCSIFVYGLAPVIILPSQSERDFLSDIHSTVCASSRPELLCSMPITSSLVEALYPLTSKNRAGRLKEIDLHATLGFFWLTVTDCG